MRYIEAARRWQASAGMSGTLILAVDTSTRASIVVLGGAEPLAVSRREVQHRHGSHVLEQIDEVLALAGRTLDDVDALAVGTGPGSFTGLRVGLATLKTVAYARELPLVGVMSSDALRLAGSGRAPRQERRWCCRPAPETTTSRGSGKIPCSSRLASWPRALARRSLCWPSTWRRSCWVRRRCAWEPPPWRPCRRPCWSWPGPASTRARPMTWPQLTPAYVALPRGRQAGGGGPGMVARPPVRLVVAEMTAEDIPAVHAIESASFPTPWPPYAFRQELETNRMARYIVVRAGAARHRLRRHLAHGRRGPRDHLRGAAGVPPARHRRPAAGPS